MNFSKRFGVFLVSFILLLMTFQFNVFNTSEDYFFSTFQRDSEELVYYRLNETEKHGLFSHGGLLGRHSNENNTTVSMNYTSRYPYSIWSNKGEYDYLYKSSFALQGFFYYFTSEIFQVLGATSPEAKLYFNKFLTASLLALEFSIIAVFLWGSIGWLPTVTYLLSIICSGWVVNFANNLYWMFFLLYLPFLVLGYFLYKEYKGGDWSTTKTGGWVAFAIYLKSLAGYEYISSIMIATMMPLIFFSIWQSWDYKKLARRFFIISAFAILGFVLALFTQLIQLIFVEGASSAIQTVKHFILYRTYGNPNDYDDLLIKYSLESNVVDVLDFYFHQWVFKGSPNYPFNGVNIQSVIAALSILTLLGFGLVKTKFKPYAKLCYAFIIVSWLSILSPLSWYILAKGHSYVHRHMNSVLWSLPFIPFVFTYGGFILGLLVKNIDLRKRNNQIAFLLLSIFLFVFYEIYQIKQRENYVENSTEIVYLKNQELSIRYNKELGKLIYMSHYCQGIDTHRYFVHAYRKGTNIYFNLDFSWDDQEKVAQSRFLNLFINKTIWQKYNTCIAVVDLDSVSQPIERIFIGQYEGGWRYWSYDITASQLVHGDISEIQSVDFSDERWANGIHNDQNMFFMKNTYENRYALNIGDMLLFKDNKERKVTELSFSDKYINVRVDGEPLLPNLGYPNTIKIIKNKVN